MAKKYKPNSENHRKRLRFFPTLKDENFQPRIVKLPLNQKVNAKIDLILSAHQKHKMN